MPVGGKVIGRNARYFFGVKVFVQQKYGRVAPYFFAVARDVKRQIAQNFYALFFRISAEFCVLFFKDKLNKFVE